MCIVALMITNSMQFVCHADSIANIPWYSSAFWYTQTECIEFTISVAGFHNNDVDAPCKLSTVAMYFFGSVTNW